MSISTSHRAIVEYEPVLRPGSAVTTPPRARPSTALFRLRSAQPSRRAVLHLQATGDPVLPAELAGWFTERSCHFYLAGLRRSVPPARLRRSGRATERAFSELDGVRAYLRETEGIEHVIVSAQGAAAVTAALWCDRRRAGGGPGGPSPLSGPADALILYRPAWPRGRALRLDAGCPVLILSADADRPWRLLRQPAVPLQLAGHVTWLQVPDTTAPAGLAELIGGAGRQAFLDELGRWLGAYMYGEPPGGSL